LDAWPGSAERGILRTPEIAGRRFIREGGLRVAAPQGGPQRRQVTRSEEGRSGLSNLEVLTELGSWRRRAAVCWGSVVGCCSAAAQRLPLRAEVCSLGRGQEAEGPLPRPGVEGGGRGWGGQVGRQGWPRQVTLGRVGLYTHIDSVLHLSHVHLALCASRREH
jgi:hypothetical protein